MEYLAKLKLEDVEYEAHVDVRTYDGGVECEFSTNFGYIDDVVYTLDDIPDMIQDKLLEEACDMFNQDDGADYYYDAMRDA